MNVFVSSHASYKISPSCVQRQVKALLAREKIFCEEVCIYFVSKEQIKKLHIQFFGKKSATDCISLSVDLPMKDKDSKSCQLLGEVFVCPEVAISYAKKHGLLPEDEITLYLVHGLLHLIGYDDLKEKDQKIMRQKEKEWLDFLKESKLGISKKHEKLWALA